MKNLVVSEELDFSYLLGLMRPLHEVDEFSWLPELFALIGHENLIKLCKYCGGSTITLPTLDQLQSSIEALEYFYKVNISKTLSIDDVPITSLDLVEKISSIYNARNYQERNI